jgi:hypothetical protein
MWIGLPLWSAAFISKGEPAAFERGSTAINFHHPDITDNAGT